MQIHYVNTTNFWVITMLKRNNLKSKYRLSIFLICVSINCDTNITNPNIDTTKRIAYISNDDENPGIYTMDVDGANKKLIYSTSVYLGGISWHPDGSKIVFTQYGNVHALDLLGLGTTRLTNLKYNYSPKWSPDGTKIVFCSTRDNEGTIYDNGVDVFIMDADGSNQINLTNNPASDSGPSWSPDGSKIVFSSWRDGVNIGEIYVMNIDGSEQTRLTYNSYVDDYPDWSPDGSKIVFSSHKNNWPEIYIMNSDGSGQRRLTFLQSGYYPSWSPEGDRIAFIASVSRSLSDPAVDSGPGPYDLFVMNRDGSNIINLTNSPWHEYHPAWSPTSIGR